MIVIMMCVCMCVCSIGLWVKYKIDLPTASFSNGNGKPSEPGHKGMVTCCMPAPLSYDAMCKLYQHLTARIGDDIITNIWYVYCDTKNNRRKQQQQQNMTKCLSLISVSAHWLAASDPFIYICIRVKEVVVISGRIKRIHVPKGRCITILNKPQLNK